MAMTPIAIDYRRGESRSRAGLGMVWALIVIFGVLLPYLGMLPAALARGGGSAALRASLAPRAIAFLEITTAFIWVPIVAGTLLFRWPLAAVVSAAIGFAFAVYGYVSLGFSTDAQTAIGYVFVPVFSAPLVVVGWVIGFVIDRYLRRRAARTP